MQIGSNGALLGPHVHRRSSGEDDTYKNIHFTYSDEFLICFIYFQLDNQIIRNKIRV